MLSLLFFFFNDPAPTEIYTLSLHDALPISVEGGAGGAAQRGVQVRALHGGVGGDDDQHGGEARGEHRSEEHTSELQSRRDLVCRLLLEKKKKTKEYTRLEYTILSR